MVVVVYLCDWWCGYCVHVGCWLVMIVLCCVGWFGLVIGDLGLFAFNYCLMWLYDLIVLLILMLYVVVCVIGFSLMFGVFYWSV